MVQFSVFCVDRNSTLSCQGTAVDDETMALNKNNEISRAPQRTLVERSCSILSRMNSIYCVRWFCNGNVNSSIFYVIVALDIWWVSSLISRTDDVFNPVGYLFMGIFIGTHEYVKHWDNSDDLQWHTNAEKQSIFWNLWFKIIRFANRSRYISNENSNTKDRQYRRKYGYNDKCNDWWGFDVVLICCFKSITSFLLSLWLYNTGSMCCFSKKIKKESETSIRFWCFGNNGWLWWLLAFW